MNHEQVYVIVRRPEPHPAAVLGFLTTGRGSILPSGARWLEDNPATGWWTREPTDAEIFREALRAYPDAIGYRLLPGRFQNGAEHPELKAMGREYRGAWRDDAGKLGHDMKTARELHRDKLRRGRVQALAELDIEATRADEDGDAAKKADVVRRKKALRDAPAHPDIEAAQTIEQLREVKLGILP